MCDVFLIDEATAKLLKLTNRNLKEFDGSWT